jgi:hypothetical protein
MSAPLKEILVFLSSIAKKGQVAEILCPKCGERHRITKYGFYFRYLFTGGEMVPIQRYCCGNRECPRRTFSILPHPFLPILRISLCFLMTLLEVREREGLTVNRLATVIGSTWSTVRRMLRTAVSVRRWFSREQEVALWRPSPCLHPQIHWTAFTQAFSWAFFPNRFR